MLNLSFLLVMGLCLCVALSGNLFSCAVLLGQTFVSLLLAMSLFGPASRLVSGFFDLPIAYMNATIFLLVWGLGLVILRTAPVKMLDEEGTNMEFAFEMPLRIASGLVAGLLCTLAVSTAMVMVPPIEGVYFKVPASCGGLPRKAAALYRIFSLSPQDVVYPAQLEAGASWAKRRVARLTAEGDTRGAAELVSRFNERYSRPDETAAEKDLREAAAKELQEAALGNPSGTPPAQ